MSIPLISTFQDSGLSRFPSHQCDQSLQCKGNSESQNGWNHSKQVVVGAYTRGAPSSSLAYKLCKPRSSIDLEEAFCAPVAERMTGYPYYASFNALFSSAKDGCQLREIIGHLLAQLDINEDTDSEPGDASALLYLRFRNADL
jgi:hypothetical protein